MARSGVSNLGGVVKSLAAAKRKALADAQKVVRNTANGILTGVVEGTPEDTSTAIGDWQVGLETTPEGLVNKPDPGGATAIAKGAATIATAKLGQNINIVNNQPYVEGLNAGNAVSKPSGWIEAAIDNATRGSR